MGASFFLRSLFLNSRKFINNLKKSYVCMFQITKFCVFPHQMSNKTIAFAIIFSGGG